MSLNVAVWSAFTFNFAPLPVVHNARIDIASPSVSLPRPRGLGLLSAGLFSVLAMLAIEINAQWMTALDTSAWNWFNAHRSPYWQVDADGIFSYIGRPFHVAAAGVVSGTLLALQGRSVKRAVLVIATVGAGAAAEQTLKAIVERTPANLAELHDGSLLAYAHSFPSGHVTGSATLLGTIAVCLGAGRSRAAKVTLAAVVAAGVLFVAFLAMYSRAHLFTDVIGGMVLGGALVALGTAVLRTANGPPPISR